MLLKPVGSLAPSVCDGVWGGGQAIGARARRACLGLGTNSAAAELGLGLGSYFCAVAWLWELVLHRRTISLWLVVTAGVA